jgi:hypothetical protein
MPGEPSMTISQYILTKTDAAVTWTAAEAQAQSAGGHLASDATTDEHSFFVSVFTDTDPLHKGVFNGEYGPWLGLVQAPGSPEPSGGWTWLDGTPMTEIFWYPTQPDNHINDNRGLFVGSPAGPAWGDHVDDPVGSGYPPVKSFITELADSKMLLRGGGETDIVYGGDIANVIRGAGSPDWLDGGGGADTLMGGAGRDRFHFASTADADGDHIIDLTDNDRIIMNDIDANERKGGDQHFHIVADFDRHAGQLTLTYDGSLTTIAGDTNGDAVADFAITAEGDVTGFSNFLY